MPKFAANLWFMFKEHAFLDRFEAAQTAGFDAVEFQFPYAWAADDIRRQLDELDLAQVLINMPAGDWEAGERGMAGDPSRVADFKESITLTKTYVAAMSTPAVHCMSGVLAEGADRKAHLSTYVDNLRRAGDVLGEVGATVLVEALNPKDVPGYLIATHVQALEAVHNADHENVKLQYDLYHARMNGADVVAELRAYMPLIKHMQVAHAPGRGEPDLNAYDYVSLFAAIDDLGYRGFIGCEYTPNVETRRGLRVWGAPFGLG